MMKLVYALIVIVNGLPVNTDGVYFENPEVCNTHAYRTEKGVAGENRAWDSTAVNIQAYCLPRLVPEKDQTLDK